jgi:hypothetical protein
MTWSLSGNLITLDAGTTENDLSGLSSITGVTTTTDTGAIYYDLGNLQMSIKGTLYHDPDEEVLIMHHEHSTGNSAGGYQRGLIIPSGGTYYYGKETTANGNTRLSSSCGLFITGNGFTFWEPWDNGFVVSGTLVARGGVMHISRSLTMPGVLDIKDLTIMNNDNNHVMEIRDVGKAGNGSTIDNLILVRVDPLDPWKIDNKQSYTFKESAIARKYGDYYQEVELLDMDFSQNIRSSDTRHNANQTNKQHMDVHVINSASGSAVRNGWRQGNDVWFGSLFIQKEVSFNLKDSFGVNVSGCKVYLQDNPSDYKRNAQFKYNTGIVSGDSNLSRGVASDNGVNSFRTYDYTTPIVYDKTTDANGNVAKFRVLTSVHFLDLSVKDSSHSQYYDKFTDHQGRDENHPDVSTANLKWRQNDNTDPRHEDINTTAFGGFFMPDRRSDSNSTADDFTFKFCSYGHLLSNSTQALKGIGELQVNWVLFDDKTISEPDIIEVLGYGAIDTPQKFYDRAKAHLYNNYNGETELIVTRDGNTITADGYNVIITDDASAAAFSISGDTITIKATTFIGNILTDSGHTTSLDGDVEVIGTFGDIVNLPWEVTNVESGSTVQLYNVTRDVELHNDVTDNGTQGEFTGQVSGMSTNVTITANTKGNSAVTLTGTGSTSINGLIDAWNTANPNNTITLATDSDGTQVPADSETITIPAGAKATAIGSYSDQETAGAPYAKVGDTIRLRITCQAGVFAFFPYETFGITTTSGITFKADQRLDFFYNDNGIDGSTLDRTQYTTTGTLIADYTLELNDDGAIDIYEDGDDGKVDVRAIYAFYVYETTTTEGIENWFGAITPIDHQNYRVNNGYDIKLENRGTNTVLVTGARLFREDGQSVLSSASNAPMMQDNGELVQYIRTQVNESIEQNIPPAVSDAVNANETITTIKKKTNLIPGLL